MKAEKEIKIPGDLKVSVGYLKNQKCLIIENKMDKKFVFVSNSLGLLKKQKTLLLKAIDSTSVNKLDLSRSAKSIEIEMGVLNKKYRKKLSVRGLGYRMRVIENTEKLDHNVLELKVGYSHLKLLRFSSDIKIKIVKKTRIIIESLNKVKLGNFAKEVWSARKPDVYKGKGFWFKYEKMKLKDIKKK